MSEEMFCSNEMCMFHTFENTTKGYYRTDSIGFDKKLIHNTRYKKSDGTTVLLCDICASALNVVEEGTGRSKARAKKANDPDVITFAINEKTKKDAQKIIQKAHAGEIFRINGIKVRVLSYKINNEAGGSVLALTVNYV